MKQYARPKQNHNRLCFVASSCTKFKRTFCISHLRWESTRCGWLPVPIRETKLRILRAATFLRRVPCRSPQRRSQAQAPCLGCSTGESLALSLLSPSNSGPSAKGQPCQIPDLNHGTAATPLKSDFMPWKRATPLEQSHALPPLPSQARARSRAAASARSRVRDGSCCARCTLGQPLPLPLETDHATAPAPYRKTGAAPRREVLNCRQSTGCRFKIRDHHFSRLHQIRPGVPAHMQPMVRRTGPTKAPFRNPCQSDADSRKSNVRLTRACAESSRMTWGPNPQPGAPHVGEEVSRPRVEKGANATTPEGHEILPGSGGTYSRKFRVPVP